MPGFAAHYLFGLDVYHSLPKGDLKKTISDHKQAYCLGLQGPDIFLYCPLLIPFSDRRNYGSHMHDYLTGRFFDRCLLKMQQTADPADKTVITAYLSGFFCHYCLDYHCHPDIYNITEHDFARHVNLESHLDKLLLAESRYQSPTAFPRNRTIRLTAQDKRLIAGFLSECIQATYFTDHTGTRLLASPAAIRFALFCVTAGHRILTDRHGRRQKLFSFHPVPRNLIITDNCKSDDFSEDYYRDFCSCKKAAVVKCRRILANLSPFRYNQILAEAGNHSYHSG